MNTDNDPYPPTEHVGTSASLCRLVADVVTALPGLRVSHAPEPGGLTLTTDPGLGAVRSITVYDLPDHDDRLLLCLGHGDDDPRLSTVTDWPHARVRVLLWLRDADPQPGFLEQLALLPIDAAVTDLLRTGAFLLLPRRISSVMRRSVVSTLGRP